MPEQSERKRCRVRWHIAVKPACSANSMAGQVIQGITQELSADSAVMLLEADPGSCGELAVQLRIPPLSQGGQPAAIIASARLQYSVCAARDGCFRVGILFVKLAPEDRERLESCLRQHLGERASAAEPSRAPEAAVSDPQPSPAAIPDAVKESVPGPAAAEAGTEEAGAAAPPVSNG